MNKPLHKDPSFWIVAVVALIFANAAQLSLGLPWFKQKVLDMLPAPRTPGFSGQPVAGQGSFRAQNQPGLDFSKKTYAWQRPQYDQQVIENLPEQVRIVPTEYTPPSGGWATSEANKAIGIRLPAEFVVQAAYQWNSRSRMVLPDPMPAGQYDYVANLPGGDAFEALRKEVETQLGLIATRETRSMDVLLLKVHHADAPGLQSLESLAEPSATEPGTIGFRTLPHFSSFIEVMLQRPVVDATELAGEYNIQLSQSLLRESLGRQSSSGLERARQTLMEQFGLELVETNTPVEVLVVKRVNQTADN